LTKVDVIKRNIREILRYRINKENRKLLLNRNFSLIASNCTGGVIYHELGLEFLSPTVNMFFEASDFVKFCGNIDHYLKAQLVLVPNDNYSYPIVRCDDILIHCVHYNSLEEIQKKWKSRANKINRDNIFLIMSERDGCTKADIMAFNKLPYKNKVIFVHEPMPEIYSAVYIPGTELNGEDGHWVQPGTSYISRFSGKRYIDKFDYVSFLNSRIKKVKEGE
jgi:uncharacterized protein (DUF1919 family)